MQVIQKAIVRTIVWVLLLTVGLFTIVATAVQIPYIQTKIVQKVAKIISQKIGFPTQIDYVHLNWFDTILLEGVTVKDGKDSAMIYVDELSVNFNYSSLLEKGHNHIDGARLYKANVKLIRNTDDHDLNFNEFIRQIRALTSTGDTTTGKSPVFSIGQVRLIDSEFSMNDPEEDYITDRFDHYHFRVKNIQAQVKDLVIVSDTFEIDVNNFSAVEPVSGLTINNLHTFFRISEIAMEFRRLNLLAGQSQLKDSVIFNFIGTSAFKHFVDSVSVGAHLENSVIYSGDLAVFAPEMKELDEFYTLSGDFKGSISRLTVKNTSLQFGAFSSLEGNIQFDGLPNLQETFMEINLKKSQFHVGDLKKYIGNSHHNKIKKFGMVHFTGQFLGFLNDFVANGKFATDLGRFTSDINLKLGKSYETADYSGSLATSDFNLGRLIDLPEFFKNVSLSGSIEGRGLTIESADFQLKASVNKLDFKGYTYKNIITDARFAKELFIGQIEIGDPNLKFSANAYIDIREGQNSINIQAKLDTALLKPLKFTEYDLVLSTFLDVNMRGLQVDSITGDARLRDLYVNYKGEALDVSALDLSIRSDFSGRSMHLVSDNLEAEIYGEYEFTTLFNDASRIVKEYILNFKNRQDEIDKYYAQLKPAELQKYNLEYKLNLKDINPVIHLFLPGTYLSKNTVVSGSFTGGYTSIFSLDSEFDTLSYKDYNFYNSKVELNSSKIADSANVLAVAYVFSKEQQIKKLAGTENLVFEAVWDRNHISFFGEVNQQGDQFSTNLKGRLDFLEDATQISFNNTELKVLDTQWKLADDNFIRMTSEGIEFHDVKLTYDDQILAINGVLADSSDKKLIVQVNNFKLENINPVIAEEVFGVMNGFAEIQSPGDEPYMESVVSIHGFKISDFLVGDVIGQTSWEPAEKRLDINVEVDRLNRIILDMKGAFYPQNEDNQLALKAKLNQAQLNITEPFINDYFTQIAGVANGDLNISGTLQNPILTGTGKILGGKVKINYLNTFYSFDGDLLFDENEIGVRRVKIIDDRNNHAELNGGVFHDGFKNVVLDLSANMDNFKVLNTSATDNSLYYGTGIVSGKVNFLGAISNMTITANAVSKKGTRIFIPISGSESIEQQDYIHFLNKSDTLRHTETTDDTGQLALTGLKLDFDLDITPDAYCEIIFDLKAGDIIRGRGNGKLKLQIDTQGDFNMFGDYEIAEGGYNFTLYNIINKEFKIVNGSKISWYGDPYKGILAIKADYEQVTSLAPLISDLDEESANDPKLRRGYPAKVQLDLQGDLLAPEIDFNIEVSNYPQMVKLENGQDVPLYSYVMEFKQQIAADEQELRRQVFSLIILRRFSETNSFSIGKTLNSSVSELLSNQLSYWMTQVDENLEIDLNLTSLDDEAFNTFQLRLSYTFLNGRLRITRDGGFTNIQNETSASSIAGEWTLEYLLTSDGKFRVKMYNRNNYNYSLATAAINNSTSTTAGVSLMYTQTFNDLKDIFIQTRKKQPTPVTTEPVPTLPKDKLKEDDEDTAPVQTEDISKHSIP